MHKEELIFIYKSYVICTRNFAADATGNKLFATPVEIF